MTSIEGRPKAGGKGGWLVGSKPLGLFRGGKVESKSLAATQPYGSANTAVSTTTLGSSRNNPRGSDMFVSRTKVAFIEVTMGFKE